MPSNSTHLNYLYANDEEASLASSINSEFKRNLKNDPSNYWLWSDIYRARWILFKNTDKDPVRTLRQNNVCSEAIRRVVGKNIDLAPVRKEKRTDKYQKIIDWCLENHLVQIEPAVIAEVGGVSYATALKFIKDRPDLFYRIKKGLYEARNPSIVRAEEKNS
jgi:hypothetical protein